MGNIYGEKEQGIRKNERTALVGADVVDDRWGTLRFSLIKEWGDVPPLVEHEAEKCLNSGVRLGAQVLRTNICTVEGFGGFSTLTN